MKRIAPVLLAAGLATTWVGCQSANESDVVTSSEGDSQLDTSNLTLVTLSVPNMT